MIMVFNVWRAVVSTTKRFLKDFLRDFASIERKYPDWEISDTPTSGIAK